jgi:hypothetical protein
MEVERRLPLGPLIAAVGGVLLIVSLFLDWYDGVTGFTVFEALDLVLVALALLSIVSLAGGMGLIREPVSPVGSLIGAVVTILVVLSQVVNDPPAIVASGRGHAIGTWLALAGAALMVVGALLAWAHISLAVDVRPRPAPGSPGGTGRRATPPRDEPRARGASAGDAPGPGATRPADDPARGPSPSAGPGPRPGPTRLRDAPRDEPGSRPPTLLRDEPGATRPPGAPGSVRPPGATRLSDAPDDEAPAVRDAPRGDPRSDAPAVRDAPRGDPRSDAPAVRDTPPDDPEGDAPTLRDVPPERP